MDISGFPLIYKVINNNKLKINAYKYIFLVTKNCVTLYDPIQNLYLLELYADTGCVCMYVYIYIYIQGVPGGMCQTSGECSLC